MMKNERILLKLSGEILSGSKQKGLSKAALLHYASEIKELYTHGYALVIVIGGGNLYRGREGKALGLDHIHSDHMGMLATLMNGIALSGMLEKEGVPTKRMSRLPLGNMFDAYSAPQAIEALKGGHVVVVGGGTGVPCFTTDSAGVLTGIELGADMFIKGTNVDGIYAEDPKLNPDAQYYERLTWQEALDKKLCVLDQTAMMLCLTYKLPAFVYNATKKGLLLQVVTKGKGGTFVHV